MLFDLLRNLLRLALYLPRFFGLPIGWLLQRAAMADLRKNSPSAGWKCSIEDKGQQASLTTKLRGYRVRAYVQSTGTMHVGVVRGGAFVVVDLKKRTDRLEIGTGWLEHLFYSVVYKFMPDVPDADKSLRFATRDQAFNRAFPIRIADPKAAEALSDDTEVLRAGAMLYRRWWRRLTKIQIGGYDPLSVGIVINDGSPFFPRATTNTLRALADEIVDLAIAVDAALARGVDQSKYS